MESFVPIYKKIYVGEYKQKVVVLVLKEQFTMKQIYQELELSEFNNHVIDEALNTFGISQFLSRKGNPYDNTIAESIFKIFKTEFINNSIFSTLNELEVDQQIALISLIIIEYIPRQII